MTDDHLPDEETYVEWGYRLPDGREVWENDYGTDGRWTPNMPDEGIRNIDVDERTTAADVARVLAGRGTVLSREVTISRGPTVRHLELAPPEIHVGDQITITYAGTSRTGTVRSLPGNKTAEFDALDIDWTQ